MLHYYSTAEAEVKMRPQYLPEQFLTPALEHWNSNISWFPAPGKVTTCRPLPTQP